MTTCDVEHPTTVEPVSGPTLASRVRTIWADSLQFDEAEIDLDADFFELGGDSLSAIMILNRVAGEYHARLTEAELFTCRTINGMCAMIQSTVVDDRETAILRRDTTGDSSFHPASRGQQRLWYMDQSMDRPEVYNVPFLLRWQGPLDPEALRQAFEQLDDRHEILRTHLEIRDGQLCQIIGDSHRFELPLVDLRSMKSTEHLALVTAESNEDARTPFDLRGNRLYRTRLYRTGSEEYLWFLNFHHAITDGWSFGVMFGELEKLYEAARDGKPSNLAPLPIQYADFSRWERERINSSSGREHLEFWRKQLSGPIPSLDLPFAKPRAARRACRGGYQQFLIPNKLVRSIDQLARDESVTRYMVCLAAWQVLLGRLTGQTDIAVGSPVAGRTRPETEALIGMFTNMLVLRTSLEGNPTFREVLERVRQTRMDAFIHQETPIDLLTEELNPVRDASRQAFFQTAFYYQNVRILPERFARARLTNIPVHNGTSMFDIRFVLEDGPFGALWAWVEQDADLFTADDVHRIISQFQTVLGRVCEDSSVRIGELSLMNADERRQILFDWNNTAGAYPELDTLPDAFLRQAADRPEAIALSGRRESLTYGRLRARAEEFAGRLIGAGVRPGDRVGVCLNRTTDMVAAVLAVHLAGGAYVPLDPAYPADRLEFMLEDCGATALITHGELKDRLPVGDRRVLLTDARDSQLAASPFVRSLATPDQVAYIIYTSGSTGRPKGVVVRHRAAINTIDWVNKTLRVGPSDCLLFVTSLSFDLSVYDIFGVLGAGGSLYVTNEQELREPQKLADLLHSGRITMWDSAPAALQQVTPFLRPGDSNAALRLVMLSGDWIPVKLPDQIRGVFQNARVISLGGATEAAIWSNWYPIEQVDPTWSTIPYGKPIRNAVYHVLDESLEPLPVGMAGELHIGGLCLADGYLNRPELTAERFIADPFRPGERLYKTGDLARYGADGNIEFLGRIDHQVKVRGFRVELGEIEAGLCQHPDVREAVVKPFRDEGGVVTLTAFVVGEGRVDAAELSALLRERMPEYMVPAQIVFLDSMPVTPNGKLDRAALKQPAPCQVTRTEAKPKEPPANDLEATIAEAFSEVLGVGAVSRDDDFFDLGGHSLKAAELVARIQRYLGFELKLAVLLAAPTVRKLGMMIQQKLELGRGCVVPLNEEGDYPPLFMIAGAGGHVFAFQRFSRMLGPEFPAYGMKAIGVDGAEPPLDRIEEIAERYLTEILQHRPGGPYVLSGYSVGGLVAYELALRMEAIGLPVARVIMFDTFAPGYPRRRIWPVRMAIHAKNFLFGGSIAGKWAYLRQRLQNLRHRTLSAAGYGHLDMPDYPGITGLSAEVIKMVWAGLERANARYRPSKIWGGRLVVVRSERQEAWAATVQDDPLLGWGDWASGPIETFTVPAGHMEFFEDRNVTFLVDDMREVIRSTRPDLARANPVSPAASAKMTAAATN